MSSQATDDAIARLLESLMGTPVVRLPLGRHPVFASPSMVAKGFLSVAEASREELSLRMLGVSAFAPHCPRYITSAVLEDLQFVVMSRVQGVSWSQTAVSVAIAREMGSIIRTLHSVPPPEATGPFSWLTDRMSSSDLWKASGAPKGAREQAEAASASAFIHTEVIPDQFVGDPPCLVDYEGAAIFDPLFDLLGPVAFLGGTDPKLFRAFMTGYGTGLTPAEWRRLAAYAFVHPNAPPSRLLPLLLGNSCSWRTLDDLAARLARRFA